MSYTNLAAMAESFEGVGTRRLPATANKASSSAPDTEQLYAQAQDLINTGCARRRSTPLRTAPPRHAMHAQWARSTT